MSPTRSVSGLGGALRDRNATFRLKFLERRTAAAKDVGEVRCGGGDVLSLQLTERDRQVLGRPHGPKRCLELHRLLVARAQLVARLPMGIADLTHRLEKGDVAAQACHLLALLVNLLEELILVEKRDGGRLARPLALFNALLEAIHLILELFAIAVRPGGGGAHFVAAVKRARLPLRQRPRWRIMRSLAQLRPATVLCS